jgi:hypothetical protein
MEVWEEKMAGAADASTPCNFFKKPFNRRLAIKQFSEPSITFDLKRFFFIHQKKYRMHEAFPLPPKSDAERQHIRKYFAISFRKNPMRNKQTILADG